jgi:hypothetical protein
VEDAGQGPPIPQVLWLLAYTSLNDTEFIFFASKEDKVIGSLRV